MTPDQILVLVATAFMIAAYCLIPRRPYLGWVMSFTGNSLYLLPTWHLHRIDLMVLPCVFTVLALWNAIRELKKSSN